MILIKVSPGLEPGLLDSKSRVLTDCTTKPREFSPKKKGFAGI